MQPGKRQTLSSIKLGGFRFDGYEVGRYEPDTTNPHLAQMYRIGVPFGVSGVRIQGRIKFQHKPVADVGRNGLSEDLLLWIVLDRLEKHQKGSHASPCNEEAATHIKRALECLTERRKR